LASDSEGLEEEFVKNFTHDFFLKTATFLLSLQASEGSGGSANMIAGLKLSLDCLVLISSNVKDSALKQQVYAFALCHLPLSLTRV
jgi:hypothetical protein